VCLRCGSNKRHVSSRAAWLHRAPQHPHAHADPHASRHAARSSAAFEPPLPDDEASPSTIAASGPRTALLAATGVTSAYGRGAPMMGGAATGRAPTNALPGKDCGPRLVSEEVWPGMVRFDRRREPRRQCVGQDRDLVMLVEPLVSDAAGVAQQQLTAAWQPRCTRGAQLPHDSTMARRRCSKGGCMPGWLARKLVTS
jgi:hypothetical protein